MMRTLLIALLLFTLACTPAEEVDDTEAAEPEKTSAEEAYDAGANARKKAEEIRDQNQKKVDDAVEATEP